MNRIVPKLLLLIQLNVFLVLLVICNDVVADRGKLRPTGRLRSGAAAQQQLETQILLRLCRLFAGHQRQ
jgi:hypothetical protein